jgi:hypothetical protein
MTMHIYGIIAIQDVDKQGDIIMLEGFDAGELLYRPLMKKVGSKDLGDIIGHVYEIGAVREPKDSQDVEYDHEIKNLSEIAKGKPFFWARAEVFDKSLIATLDAGIKLYYGMSGSILEKDEENGVCQIKRAIAKGLGLTLFGAHEACLVQW